MLTTCVENFSRRAATYDAYADIQRRTARQLMEELGDTRADDILEIGCGTGILTRLLREHFPQASITALDASVEMIEEARGNLSGERVEFIRGDGGNVESSRKFDLVVSNACFHWLSDHEASLAAYARLVSDGGRIVFSSFGPRTFSELGACARDTLNYRIPAESFPDMAELERWLGQYFSDARVRQHVFRQSFSSLMELLRGIHYTGTRGGDCVRKGLVTPEVFERLEKRYLERFGKIEASYEVFFARAVRRRE